MTQIDSLMARWPGTNRSLVIVGPHGILHAVGDVDHRFKLASVTKLFTAVAVLIAHEEGALALDDEAGPTGSTIRHLLAHASGLAASGEVPLAAPGRRRIYSNAGFEVLGQCLTEATAIPTADYIEAAVFEPLGMASTSLAGSPAHAAVSTTRDLAAFTRELLSSATDSPTLGLLDATTLLDARTVQFAGLDGVLPGYGVQRPNDWGLGMEVRSQKSPHWTGHANSPKTFGHFGQSGTFVWIDPVAGLAVVGLGEIDFGNWAVELWPIISDAALTEFGVI